jgi:pentose-5-phosphate-3-epimerase
MAGSKILVPFNFTNWDEKALHHVARNYAGVPRIKVTLFHVYMPPPDIDTYSNPALQRLKSTMASFSEEARKKERDLKRIIQDLHQTGFLENQLDYVIKPRQKSLGAEIVEMVLNESYDTIVMSREPGKVTRAFTRSVHDKLLSSLKGVTISIIT